MGVNKSRLKNYDSGYLDWCDDAIEHESTSLTLNDLPDLALMTILSHLPFADRLSAELVCRRWNKLSKEKQSWKMFTVLKNRDLQMIADSREIKERKMEQLLARFGKHIEEIQFMKLDFKEKNGRYNSEFLYANYLPMIIEKCPQIRHVLIDCSLMKQYIKNFAKILPNLKSISLVDYTAELATGEWFHQILRKCQNLEYLYIGLAHVLGFKEHGTVTITKFPATLKHVSFGLLVERFDGNLETLVKMVQKQCPQLASLDSRFCCCEYENTAGTIAALREMKSFTHLRETCLCSLQYHHSILYYGIWENLRTLSFYWMDISLFNAIATNCPNVEFLGIDKISSDVSSNQIKQALEQNPGTCFPVLKSLYLGDYTAVEEFTPLYSLGGFQHIFFTSEVKISLLCAIISANPELEIFYVDQNFLPCDFELMYDILAKTLDSKCVQKRNELNIFCRNHGATDKLRSLFPWLRISKGDFEHLKMPIMERYKFAGLSEIPSFAS